MDCLQINDKQFLKKNFFSILTCDVLKTSQLAFSVKFVKFPCFWKAFAASAIIHPNVGNNSTTNDLTYPCVRFKHLKYN